MDNSGNTRLPVVDKRYSLRYKNEYDQVDVLEGILVHPDLNGFLVLDLSGKNVLIPKDRVFVLREIDKEDPSQADTGKQPNTE